MFVDAQEMYKNHPDTFEVPSRNELSKLKIGDIVKVCYDNKERFWVVIKSINDEKITALIDNNLLVIDEFAYGDTIEFEKRHVYSIYEE